MQGKKTFLLYVDMIHVFEELTDEQAGKLIKHVFQYVNDQEPSLQDQLLKIAFAPIKNVLKKDLEEWLKICDRNSENGKKGGRPKNPTEPKEPNGFSGNPNNPVKADKDKDKDKDILKSEKKDIDITNAVFIEMTKDTRWIEAICMNHKTEPDLLIEHLRKFYWHCITIDEFKSNSSKAKQHFNNWVIKGNPFPKRKLVENFEGF